MSDRMTPISFEQLMNWVLTEKATKGTVFGVHKPYYAPEGKSLSLFQEKLETAFGPAAGPNTQLAQNIIASYYAGSRFFELKTVQVLDGEDLPVAKPCILAEDEGYNVEWSTELTVLDAFNEYIKAWFVLKLIAMEYGLGSPDGFMFNMSVGYDLEGIKSAKIDTFIEGLKNAEDTDIWKECQNYLLEHVDHFKRITIEDIKAFSPKVCDSITLSTLHGCPPEEIERIAVYLLTQKKLNTFIKCNPTLLGYEFARKTLDSMGYDYIQFDDHHFLDDLQFEDAVPMITRLMALAEENNLGFGVKLTNTFPVDIAHNELPGDEMYMSGRSLYPLTIALADRLSTQFSGQLRISYSGGIDCYNIDKIYQLGIWPITLATGLLKPGGYQRLLQMAKQLELIGYQTFKGVDVKGVNALALESLTDPHHTKDLKPQPSRKMAKQVPLIDCFVAPCKEGCPIHQDIPSYIKLVGEGKHLEALRVIIDKNPLPFITGTICNHRCMEKCTRNFYEESIHIRDVKLEAADHAFEELIKEVKPVPKTTTKKTAIIGGGPAGLAAAYFLQRGGMDATIFEKEKVLGGVVAHLIPEFRIPMESIEKDAQLVKAMGAEIRLGTKVQSLEELKSQGYDYVVFAIGAYKEGHISLNDGTPLNALKFLSDCKNSPETLNLGKHVAIIGGGNTAMDTARAAKRAEGVEHAYLVYRRTKRYMPADEEELVMAIEDGVEFMELLAPISHKDGILTCHKMVLGAPDESGRCAPVETDEIVEVLADTVIAAVGEKIETDIFTANGIELTKQGHVKVNEETNETNIPFVYAVGDGKSGPATVVNAIADAAKAAESILDRVLTNNLDVMEDIEEAMDKKGILKHAGSNCSECDRCLQCSTVCENCVDVCPNRANLSIKVKGKPMAQIIHVDMLCNECGNCQSFCPYDSAPYKDKFTLFHTEYNFEDNGNEGFLLLDREHQIYKVRLGQEVRTINLNDTSDHVNGEIKDLIKAVYEDYSYIL